MLENTMLGLDFELSKTLKIKNYEERELKRKQLANLQNYNTGKINKIKLELENCDNKLK
jgi:hypothetical protein